jgi:hypothetical protein
MSVFGIEILFPSDLDDINKGDIEGEVQKKENPLFPRGRGDSLSIPNAWKEFYACFIVS